MKEVTINWRSVKEHGLPQKEGEYLVRNKSGFMYTNINFNMKHKMFNVTDEYTECAWKEVTHWAPMEELWPTKSKS